MKHIALSTGTVVFEIDTTSRTKDEVLRNWDYAFNYATGRIDERVTRDSSYALKGDFMPFDFAAQVALLAYAESMSNDPYTYMGIRSMWETFDDKGTLL